MYLFNKRNSLNEFQDRTERLNLFLKNKYQVSTFSVQFERKWRVLLHYASTNS